MVNVALSLARIVGALFLVGLNGFFVGSEFALVRVRETAVEGFVEEGKAGAATLSEAMDNLDDYLAVTQLGITIASLGLGWIGEPAIASLIEPVAGQFLPEGVVHLVAFGVGFGTITFLHVVFGELAPKTIAIRRAERIALFVAPPMKFCYYLFLPGIIVFNGTANAFTRLLGVPPASENEESLGERELLRVITRSGRQGRLDDNEVEMIERVFELDDTTAREVMVPRPDVTTVGPNASLEDLRETVLEAQHTRYPVVDGSEDDRIVGFVDIKDVLTATDDGATAGDLARDLPVVPETVRIDELLAELQDHDRQLAAVVDEFGGFSGIVTIEDAVEVVVGDLRDVFDIDEPAPAIERQGDAYLVDGGVPVTQAERTLDVPLAGQGYDTVAGLVLDRLGHVPEVGDEVEIERHLFRIETVDGSRIETVEVRAVEEDGEDAADGEAAGGEDAADE